MDFQDITGSFEQTFVGNSRITQVLLATLQAATSVLMNPVSWNP